jgi:meso-butanediol dehydrogenase/(S,S)-butanediol dehydrogenase/diacetyl reductase
MSEFEGKIAFVTGAASGIGKACAVSLAKQGASLVVCDINATLLAATVKEIVALERPVDSQVFDVSDAASCAAAIDSAIACFGSLDILVNVAGIAAARHFTDIDDRLWRRMVGINMDSVFYLSRAALPHLLQSKGNIVNVASSAGLVGQAYNAAYCATKGAVVMLTKAIAMEYANRGVRANVVCPGGVKTPLTASFTFPEGADMSLVAKLMPLTGDLCEPQQIVDAILFLAHEKSSFITGVALPVDGGQVIG